MRTMTNPARVLVALLVVALLSACDSSGGGESGDGPTEQGRLTTETFFPTTSAAMVRAKSAAMELTMTSASSEEVRTSGLMEMGEPDERTMRMTTSVGGSEASTMIVIGRTAYVRNPSTAGKFHRLDLDHLSSRDAQLFPNLADQRSLDEQFDEFHHAVLEVVRRPESDTTLDGVPVEGYAVTVDVDELEDGARLASQGIHEVTYDFWVGADDLPRRMAFDLGGTSLRTDYSDWGAPVSVTAPDRADVVVPGEREG